MAFSTEYIYRILDRYSAPLEKITRSTKKFQDSAKTAAEKVHNLGQRMEGIGQSMANFRTMIGGAAVTASMFKVAQSASALEDAMADVRRVTNLADDGLLKMQGQLQALGRSTGMSAVGLAEMAYEGGKLGIAADQMVPFVSMVMKVSKSFDMMESEAGRSVGSIRAKLDLEVDSVDRLMQRVNYLADTTSATGSQMINIIERTSGVFKTLNIPPEVTAGWAAFANQIEVSKELSASGLNQMMVRMMQMPGMLKKMLQDPKNTVIEFLEKLEKMQELKRNIKIIKIFGLEASRFVMKAVTNIDRLKDTMEKAASSKALGSMDREFQNILGRTSTMAFRIKQTLIDTGRAIGSYILRIFDKYSASILKISDSLRIFVLQHPFLVKMAIAFGALLIAISAIVIPIGLLFSVLAAGMPIWGALLAAVGAITMPIAIAITGIIAFIAWMSGMYASSQKLRDSLSNLAAAFSPIGDLLKWIFGLLGFDLSASIQGFKIWGDAISNIINSLAAIVNKFFDNFVGPIKAIKDILSGDFGKVWEKMKGGFNIDNMQRDNLKFMDRKDDLLATSHSKFIGLQPAIDKTVARTQTNKNEISGQIRVSAERGSKVERSEIQLNQGYNLAMGS